MRDRRSSIASLVATTSFTLLADRVQPEVNIITLLLYQLSESDRVIAADVELDIREAAIREWDIQIPLTIPSSRL